MLPPSRLSHQKATGTTESRFFSEAIHCTRNRAVKAAWPAKPITSQAWTSGQRTRTSTRDAPSPLGSMAKNQVIGSGLPPGDLPGLVRRAGRGEGFAGAGQGPERDRPPHQPGHAEQVDDHLER